MGGTVSTRPFFHSKDHDLTIYRTPFELAWDCILEDSADQETLRALFPDTNGYLEDYQLSRVHKIVLGLLSYDLKEELRTASQNLVACADIKGNTPLLWAARIGDTVAVKDLIKAHADVDVFNHSRCTALHAAARANSSTSIKLLLGAGADTERVVNDGNNALHIAVTFNSGADVVECLAEAGVDVNRRNYEGRTPLNDTAVHNHLALAQILLDYGAEIDGSESEGYNPLSTAILHNADDMTRLLLHRGASYTVLSNRRRSILHYAALSGGLEVLEVLLTFGLCGIDTEASDNEGNTALQIARHKLHAPDGFVEKFEELLADVRARNVSWEGFTDNDNSSGTEDVGSHGAPKWIRRVRAEAVIREPLCRCFRICQSCYAMAYRICTGSSAWICWFLGIYLVEFATSFVIFMLGKGALW